MKRLSLKLLITLIVFLIIVWGSRTSSTSEIVTIQKIQPTKIVVETLNDKVFTLKLPRNLAAILEENNKYHGQYYIKYTKTRLGTPKLRQIKPVDEI